MSIPTHTYPSGTLYLSFNPPPDDLRLESLGRTSMGFGPRSFRPTASERIQQNMKRVASLEVGRAKDDVRAESQNPKVVAPRPSTGHQLQDARGGRRAAEAAVFK